MEINQKHLLENNVKHCKSSHYNERPQGEEISLIVIHGISLPEGKFGGDAIQQLFMGTINTEQYPEIANLKGERVSSHLVIDRKGSITQYIPFDKRAWHAGGSSFNDKPDCNNYAIGIELEGTDTIPYENIQYEKLAQICTSLIQNYPNITEKRIVGHSDIAPQRKTDPGPAFDWQHFKQLLNTARQLY